MPLVALNLIGQGVSGTPGTGTITLGAALPGFRALAATVDGITVDGNTVDVLLTDGTNQSNEIDCTYNAAAGTLSRGIVESSTTGSRLSLSPAATIRVVAVASRVGAFATEAKSDGATELTGLRRLIYSSTTFRMMALFGDGIWRSLASLMQTNTWVAAQGGGPVALTPSSSITIEASAGNFFTLAPNSNFGFANPTGLVSGRVQSFAVRIVQPASGGPRVISSWGSAFRYPGGISAVPALSTAANAVDYVYFTAWAPTEIEIVGIRKDVRAT